MSRQLYVPFDLHMSVHRNIFLQCNPQDAPVSQIIYSCKTLYMFRTVFPSIISSSKLHIQQQAYVKQLLLPAASGDKMERVPSRPGRTLPREKPGTHFTGGWVGPRAGLAGRKISPPPGFDPRAVQPVVSRYTDWATGPTSCDIKLRNFNVCVMVLGSQYLLSGWTKWKIVLLKEIQRSWANRQV